MINKVTLISGDPVHACFAFILLCYIFIGGNQEQAQGSELALLGVMEIEQKLVVCKASTLTPLPYLCGPPVLILFLLAS